jgi:pseudouridine kinase
MTNRETEILKIIKENPLISQNELAAKLGIVRSSVAVHISNLVKKGLIKGKGYILDEAPYVCVIGGANIDLQGFPEKKLKYKDSNPGTLKTSLGGVGRNIAEILAKLGVPTKLITAVGKDSYGTLILENGAGVGLNVENVLISESYATSKYLSILDSSGDMVVALNDMGIIKTIDKEYIEKNGHIIKNARLCIIDANIEESVIKYITETYNNCEFFLDTVSAAKTSKVKKIIGRFHTIKPNKLEAEMLSGMKIDSPNDCRGVAEYFHSLGVEKVYITCSTDGVYYSDSKECGFFAPQKIEVINSTGAGDAFVAGLAYSHYHSCDIKESVQNSMAAAIISLRHEETINPNTNINELNKTKTEMLLW